MSTRAEIERVASQVALRSRLVEMVMHGQHHWAVALGSGLQDVEVDVGIEDDGCTLFVSFLIRQPQADSDRYDIYVDGEHIQSAPGKIRRGRPCRLRMVYTAGNTAAPAGV